MFELKNVKSVAALMMLLLPYVIITYLSRFAYDALIFFLFIHYKIAGHKIINK